MPSTGRGGCASIRLERQNQLTTLVLPRRLYMRTAIYRKCIYNGMPTTVGTFDLEIKQPSKEKTVKNIYF
jgi:hypothetical protein